MDDASGIEYGYPTHERELKIRLSDVESLNALDPKAQQKLMDSIFTPDRRDRMIESASQDRHGRKVRYFRDISFEQLKQLLITGEQSQYSYVRNLEEQVDFDDVRSALVRRLACFEEMSISQRINLSKEDFFQRAFGENATAAEIDDVLEHFDYAHVLPFLERYVDQDVLLDIHAGGLSQKFSPFLSMSVGGIIRELSPGRVCLEIVMPDNAVTPHSRDYSGMQGEKEVFARRISVRDISRVYTDNDTLRKDEIENPARPISNYADSSGDPVGEWRWNEDIRDYLPISLLPHTT